MILFVDDEPIRMKPWTEALRRDVGDVRVCRTAQEALAALSEAVEPTFVVLDVMMPTTGDLDDTRTEFGTRTGLVLLGRIRSRFPTVPILVLTQVQDREVAQEVRRYDGVEFFLKGDLLPTELVAHVLSRIVK